MESNSIFELDFWTKTESSWIWENVSNPKLKDLKNGRTGLKLTLGEPSNKFLIPKLRPKVNLVKRKELHNTGLKQQELK